jgi:outer membrane protein TolC
MGGVPAGVPTSQTMQLSLLDAIDRGLRQNLALLLGGQETRAARAERLRKLSDLLPNLKAGVSETAEQVNLAAFGLSPSNFPGINSIVGPFGLFDARVFYSQTILDWKAVQSTRSASESVKAAEYSYKDVRELVVLVVTNLYLKIVADKSRVDAARAQLTTAEAIYRQAVDLDKAGVAAGIDVLRAQVEMQAQQQRLLAVENEIEQQKMALARAIGLPMGQAFETTDTVPYHDAPPVTLDAALADAYRNRSDYQQALALVRAAELAKKAAQAGRLPTVGFNGDYGDIGPTPGNSHGTFTASASLMVPIFQGGRTRADELQADALLEQRKAQLGDLRNGIENDLRTALLNLNTASQQVRVAESSVNLANEQLKQARDRLNSGVANTLEVVQAQEAVATATDTYITSVYAHNVAKASLARAVGIAEQSIKQYLGGQ